LIVPSGKVDEYRASGFGQDFMTISDGISANFQLSSTMTATLDSEGLMIISTTRNAEPMVPYGSGDTNVPWKEGDATSANYTSVIRKIEIKDGVTSCDPGSGFSHCSSLTSVTIGNSVTSIGMAAFSECSNLASVTIGSNVRNIEALAFWGCTGLTSVTSLNTTPPLPNLIPTR
jgi:hypothetical protein